MNMSQIGGQHWQATLDVLTGTVPLHQCFDRKPMTKIMEARAMAREDTPQPGSPRQGVEGAADAA